MAEQSSIHGLWRSRWLFILAATGSAVGLGNIWKFPYITGDNGGGAFVLVYLLCIALIGIPVMIAEVMLGRMGRQSPINTMRAIARDQNANPLWSGIGWMGAVAGFLILSFYSVVAGWAIAYVFRMGGGAFDHATKDVVETTFSTLTGNPESLLAWHTIFMVITIAVVARGVNQGLEKAIRILMPALFILLFILLIYSSTTAGFADGFSFLFSFDSSKLTPESWIVALGHAFFTLSLGLGAIMAYGAYMPNSTSIGKTVLYVGVLDTLVALVAGLVIFPIVFTNGMEPEKGPGLLFETLPLAFSQMPAGDLFGSLFFVLVVFAAWSSAISLAEPIVAWAVESKGASRASAATWVGICAWILGIGSVLSFNLWSNYQIDVEVKQLALSLKDGEVVETLVSTQEHLYANVGSLKESLMNTDEIKYKVTGKTFFDVLDYLTTNILLPLGGLFIAIFAAWIMRRSDTAEVLQISSPLLFNAWRFTLMIVAPIGIVIVFLKGLNVIG